MESKRTSVDLKSRTRKDYRFHLSYRTRWSDNDQYGHLNNTIYHQLIDSIINTYLIQHCGLTPTANTGNTGNTPSTTQLGLVISTYATFLSPTSFPTTLLLGLAVTHLGTSSATYEVGVFDEADGQVKAVGGFTHVFVERGEVMGRGRGKAGEGGRGRRGMQSAVRVGLQRILVVRGREGKEKGEEKEKEKGRRRRRGRGWGRR
ncbi:HotDog domain-containing protein [Terfezia claveryi]|nr:HotDog domain-containing protein [Terfezia claveryi]